MVAGKRWFALLAPLALLLMLLGSVGSVEAQTAATPTFVWLIPHATRGACSAAPQLNSSCLHVDPIERRFHYFPDTAEFPSVTPILTAVPKMEVSEQRVVWKWSDPTNTTFVWGNVDRVRKTVRMTLWKKEASGGVSQAYVFNKGTPRNLPLAGDPRILIRDNRLNPKTLIINRNQQVNFQNQTRYPAVITFTQAPGVSDGLVSNWVYQSDFRQAPASLMLNGVLRPGRIAVPFPVRPQNAPTPGPDDDPLVFWQEGTYRYTTTGVPNNPQGVIIVRD